MASIDQFFQGPTTLPLPRKKNMKQNSFLYFLVIFIHKMLIHTLHPFLTFFMLI